MIYYVFDTNIVSRLLRNDPNVKKRWQRIQPPDDVILGCPMVWYELRRGLLALDAKKQMRIFEILFAEFLWQDFTSDDWTLAATWWAARRAQGRPIGDADLLIAVFAHHRDAILVTDNERDFIELGVSVENWARDD